MSLVNDITAIGYAFVKRNPRLKEFVLPMYQLTSNVVAKLRSPKKRLPNNIPLTACSSVKTLIHHSQETSNWFKVIHPEALVQRRLPQTIGQVHWKFVTMQSETLPGTFVASLENARVFGDGKVITHQGELLTEVSKEIIDGAYHELPDDHEIFSSHVQLPLETSDGMTAVLSAPSGRGYYHWMFDVLPRLELINKAGIDWTTIDYFVVNDYLTRFHIETLHRMGIPKDKIKTSHWHPHIEAQQLIIPSLVGRTGHIPKWACEFLRRYFLNPMDKTDGGSLRLYLSRGRVAHRRVVNEDQVITMLMKFGFQAVLLESLSVAEQVSLMQNASVIVSPHGAGLTNIVFCEPRTKIVEILSPNAVNIMYWTLSNQVDLDYYYLLAEGEGPPPLEDRYENSADLTVNISALEDLLNVAGIHQLTGDL